MLVGSYWNIGLNFYCIISGIVFFFVFYVVTCIFITFFFVLIFPYFFVTLFSLFFSCGTWLYYGRTYDHLLPGTKWEPTSHTYCTCSSFRSKCILKSSDPTLSIGSLVVLLHYVRNSYQYPTWYYSLSANLRLNVMPSSHNSVWFLKFPKLFLPQTFGASLIFPWSNPFDLLRKYLFNSN